ncbi:PAS domain S-box protein [Pedobacter terrae]|uniref:PAS domain S-box protein n=1 Tax=Pedobacter terrae TaxID=405671 RepID=UPI002FF4AD45
MKKEDVVTPGTVNRFIDLNLAGNYEFQSILDMVTDICSKSIAFITLIDDSRNYVKIAKGIHPDQIVKESDFYRNAIKSSAIMIVSDVCNDERISSNSLVTGELDVGFFALAPLITQGGESIGALCLLDQKVGELTPQQLQMFGILSRQMMYLMEIQSTTEQLKEQLQRAESQNKSLQEIAFIQSHEIRHPLTIIMALVNLGSNGQMRLDKKWFEMLSDAAFTLDGRIKAIVNETINEKDLKLARFNRMVQEIEDYAILMLDQEGNIENWNRGAQIVKGYHEEEIVGRNFSIFYSSKDIQEGKPQKLIQEAKALGKATDEGWRVKKNGSTFWANVVITAIHDKDDNVIGFTKVTKDLGRHHDPK